MTARVVSKEEPTFSAEDVKLQGRGLEVRNVCVIHQQIWETASQSWMLWLLTCMHRAKLLALGSVNELAVAVRGVPGSKTPFCPPSCIAAITGSTWYEYSNANLTQSVSTRLCSVQRVGTTVRIAQVWWTMSGSLFRRLDTIQGCSNCWRAIFPK